ncbi:hypothetical protein EVJ50_01910 [Synechococcus sp. RSCCF101]|uniref:HNH endonuclease n=1 Tax=Synechococcus sp. RSCCF101 TaxID=2511069 RepID=UPI0012465FE0|nr:HNH endonuclease [Synechococcus sp. RSCCF101]QEY31188.1 hypothetical protein EVJ50_01910 [Synechococcus sp. RSCCF101]
MTTEEQWRPIPFELGYEVSDAGNVRNAKTLRVLRQQKTGYKKRYKQVNILKKTYQVHCLVLSAFVGLRPSPAYEGRHLNGVGSDNRLENLAWGTRRENMEDELRLGKWHKHVESFYYRLIFKSDGVVRDDGGVPPSGVNPEKQHRLRRC